MFLFVKKMSPNDVGWLVGGLVGFQDCQFIVVELFCTDVSLTIMIFN